MEDHTRPSKTIQGDSTIPVPRALLTNPTVFSSSLNVWKSSCCGWKAGSPCLGGRSCRFRGGDLRMDDGRLSSPTG